MTLALFCINNLTFKIFRLQLTSKPNYEDIIEKWFFALAKNTYTLFNKCKPERTSAR